MKAKAIIRLPSVPCTNPPPFTPDYDFTLDFLVRDYECDLQGVVNNAVYQHYLEHTRHEYLKKLGLDFAALVERKINPVVVRAELDYRSPMRSGEAFRVGVLVERFSPLRFVFVQDIRTRPDDRLVLEARITATMLNERGRPEVPEEIEGTLGAVSHRSGSFRSHPLRSR